MQNLQETQDKLLQELKKQAKEFYGYSTEEDFIHNIEKIKTFSEGVSAIKLYAEIMHSLREDQKQIELADRKAIDFEIDIKEIRDLKISEQQEAPSLGSLPETEQIDEEYFIEKEEEQNQLLQEMERERSEIAQAKEEKTEQNEQEKLLHEERRKIIAIEKPLREEKPKETSSEMEQQEKKFKLASIKNLKTTVKSLFDDDPLDDIQEERLVSSSNPQAEEMLNKVDINNLEAEKPLSDFKLDINDKLAFTKILFDGSQYELNQVVARLNSYQTMEEAKAYLSEVYYERNWKNAEEYAQRLWGLVESKFL